MNSFSEQGQLVAELKKGYILDFISNTLVKETAEEVEATQPFARQLVEDYSYPRELITTRPQYRVRSRPSDTARSFPVDIAVFSNKRKSDDDLYIVVEAKRESRFEGIEQLHDYMRFSSAKLGVWTNGKERAFFRKIVVDNQVAFEEIPNIPRYGETLDAIGKYRRKDLRTPHDLKIIFRSIRNHLAGNVVGTTRDETLAAQLINVVFCKIFDERFTEPEGLLEFRTEVDESSESVHDRLVGLFEKVRNKYPDVFDSSDAINLDPRSLQYVVGELQPYSLTESTRDAVGEAFETFIGAALKGSQGQFFTPRNVVSLLVQITDPQPGERVIDPACGSGGFLVESLRHKWNVLDNQAVRLGWSQAAVAEEKQSVAMKEIFGIEKDTFLSKVSKSYMAILGDGKGGIFCEDSLEPTSSWSQRAQQNIALGAFDVVLANPPFGKEIKVIGKKKLQQFDLAHKWKLDSEGNWIRLDKLNETMNPQILFIERCLQFLRPGGRLALILPETYFHSQSNHHIISFFENHNITDVIDLPHNTFRPFNNAKCIAIVLQKAKPQQPLVRMMVAEEMGHNHQGKAVYRWDEYQGTQSQEIWDDLGLIERALEEGSNSEHIFEVEATVLRSNKIYVPRYYWPKKIPDISKMQSMGVDFVSVGELIDSGLLEVSSGHGSPHSSNKGRGKYPYIRVKDIINWEIYRDPTAMIPEETYSALVGKKRLKPEDIVYVSRGSYRIGSVGMVGPGDTEIAMTREILIFRMTDLAESSDLDPYYLLYLLSTPVVQMQTSTKVLLDTTLPNIADRYRELLLPISNDISERRRISQMVRTALNNKWNANEAMRDLMADLSVAQPELLENDLDEGL